MKQHAIPQNVMDVEFKLFTKYTLREFSYMAIGIAFGGIFLYLYTNNQIPALVAFPVFLVSSGIGLFLGLVPINDQKADVFLTNYISAITRPTQRVWQNKIFRQKVEMIAQQKGMTLKRDPQAQQGFQVIPGAEDTSLIPSQSKSDMIIGAEDANRNQFLASETLDAIDQEEAARLQAIGQVAQTATTNIPLPSTQVTETNSVNIPSPTPQVQQQLVQQPQSNPNGAQMQPVTVPQQVPPTPVANQTTQFQQAQPAPETASQQVSPQSQTPSAQNPSPPQITVPTPEVKRTPFIQTQTAPVIIPPQQNQINLEPQKMQGDQNIPQSTTAPQRQVQITIDSKNIDQYKDTSVDPANLSGTINLRLLDKNGSPMIQGIAMIKDASGKVLLAERVDGQGKVITNRQLPQGNYQIEIQHDSLYFPVATIVVGNEKLPLIKLTSN